MDATAPTDRGRRVVVGVDGSPGADAALAWALHAAARTSARVDVVTAFPIDVYWADAYLLDQRRIEVIRSDTAARARDVVARVQHTDPAVREVPVELTVAAGAPAPHLVARADGADLLVVGSRGRGAVRSALLGSVALHCTTHAPCPVVVVHPSRGPVEPRVVVGVDDTPVARHALARAAVEAERLGARLEPVAVHQPLDFWGDLPPASAPLVAETREQAARRAQAVVTDVLGPAATVDVVEGAPGDVLVRRAEGAALLVVGSRSRLGLPGVLLGSVALHCVVHATGPVMVVHPADPDATPAGTVGAVPARA
ncbi:universal stress protein [Geodermatophilus marinus]|uniref:universal stress protein n=1 Tax=Geodermatophilus sp. LHW52908 TaxID=2303986 RepID=UPI001313FF4D|nr:universal stress protein [Geodermatophilus sp. LHW52908]